jgi:hypothetical protein
MFNVRKSIIVVLPFACAALVACRASVGEDVRVTGEAEPTVTAGDPSEPSPPASLSDEPMLAPAPAEPASEPTGGAASESAPAVDAGPDAPPAPSFSCHAQAMASEASASTCLPLPATSFTGGGFVAGTYYLTRWADQNGTCKSTTSTVQGTMTIEDFGGRKYMRYTRKRDGYQSSGVYLLEAGDDVTKITRVPVCTKGFLTPPTRTASYKASALQIVFEDEDGQQTWTRPQRTELPTPQEPIFTL